jgi:hypothetical protein
VRGAAVGRARFGEIQSREMLVVVKAHVDIDGIIELMMFSRPSAEVISSQIADGGRSQSISVNDILNYPVPKSYIS